jgi:catechol 2,3-dioxygenase-like lactoylglutathione lyase family enzyme
MPWSLVQIQDAPPFFDSPNHLGPFVGGTMTFPRMDNVGIVVDDLNAAIAFFRELGLELEGQMKIEGAWADKVVGLENIQSEIAMMKTPDGQGRIELATYHWPKAGKSNPRIPPSNTLGLHRVMFEVKDIDEVLTRLRAHGAELVGEISQYEDIYRLCYLRGPGGIILALAEKLSGGEKTL